MAMFRTSRDRPRARVLVVLCVALLALAAASCSSSDDGGSEPTTLSVVASFYPLAEAADRVGGGLVDVSNLTPAGVEPHDLELTPDQVEAIGTADLVVYLGGGFQPAVEEAVADAEGVVVDALSSVETMPAPPGEAEGGLSVDPHVWLDPTLYARIAGAIAEALTGADADSASTFDANNDDFSGELDAIDSEYRNALASCERRQIVTNHAAFGYLAAAYDLEQIAISGLEPDAEPTPDRLAELADLVERDDITTIFTEELVPPDVAQTLADEVGVKTAVLYTLEGAPEGGGDYGSAMRENLDTLRTALGCR
jgi:zinc transport system substrate-binding protein